MTFEFCSQRVLSCEKDSIRTCGEGIDTNIRTFRTDDRGILAGLPSAAVYAQIGRLFSADFRFPNLSADNNDGTIIITNPSDSDRIMYIDSFFGGSLNQIQPEEPITFEAALSISMLRDAAPGDNDIPIRNLNYGFPDNSAMIATALLGLAQGTAVSEAISAFGLFTFNLGGRIIVPPGHSFGVALNAFTLRALNPAQANAQITVIWYELDIPA